MMEPVRESAVIAISEPTQTRNILQHAERGYLFLAPIPGHPHSLQIIAADSGPGAGDLTRAMEDGFSTSTTRTRPGRRPPPGRRARSLLTPTLKIYLIRFQAKRIRVERDYADGPLLLCGVKGEVRQVISNLLVNAYDALPEEGTLRVETAVVQSPAAGNGDGERKPSGDKVVLRVIDDGPGIPQKALARIFEPFFATQQGTGTGLGLWVSDTIVTKHGGTIEVSTCTEPPGQGTTFEVMLPTDLPG